jgi:hypothetical protein
LILALPVSQTQKAHIYLGGTTNMCSISKGTFIGDASYATGNASFGIVGEQVTNSDISFNKSNGLLQCVHLLDGSVNNNIESNKALWSGQATAAVALIGVNSVQNDLKGNRGDLANYIATSGENRFESTVYSNRLIVTLTATTSQNVTISIPNRIFTAAPTFASLLSLSGGGIDYEYIPASSTATSLVFYATKKGGGTIGAGSYNVEIQASTNVG